jgi:hypothetical protein
MRSGWLAKVKIKAKQRGATNDWRIQGYVEKEA